MGDEYELICVLITMHGEVVPGDGWTNMLNTTQSNETIAMSNSQQPSTTLGRRGTVHRAKCIPHIERDSTQKLSRKAHAQILDNMIKQIC